VPRVPPGTDEPGTPLGHLLGSSSKVLRQVDVRNDDSRSVDQFEKDIRRRLAFEPGQQKQQLRAEISEMQEAKVELEKELSKMIIRAKIKAGRERDGRASVRVTGRDGSTMVHTSSRAPDDTPPSRIRPRLTARTPTPTVGASAPSTVDTETDANNLDAVEKTQTEISDSMDAVRRAAIAAKGASPEQMVDLLEELQRNKQMQQLVSGGILSWDMLTKANDGSVVMPDGSKPSRVIDYDALLSLNQRLSRLAAKEAGKLDNIQQVVAQRQTTPGPKKSASGFYPGVSVFMYPRALPATRPGQ
jgi:hypothetical protein